MKSLHCPVMLLGMCLLAFAPMASATTWEEALDAAGNASSESARVDMLISAREDAGRPEMVRKDLDTLIAFIQQWMHDARLEFFGSTVYKTGTWDMEIAESSPVYPQTFLYQGRMLTWAILEYGGFGNRERYDQARTWFERAAKAFPGNPIPRLYLGEGLTAAKQYPDVNGAPDWAVHQRAAIEHLADIVHWWIDNRLRDDGQYGGGWGDDCEMWRWWVPLLLGFEDPAINTAQAKFSRALMAQPHMAGGYTSHVYDVEHTAEDSADVLTPMMHLEPDNPEWRGHAERLVELFESLWTGKNDRGQMQFKSTYFTSEKVDLSPARACDTVYHPRAVQPALLLWQRTGDARMTKLFCQWLDTWVDAAAREERGKPAGIIPSAIHWPDGAVGGASADWWDPQNHGESGLYRFPSAMTLMTHSLLLAFHMTGNEGYLAPLRSMAAARLRYLENPTADPEPGSEAWCAAQMGNLSSELGKYRALTGNDDFDALLNRAPSPYLAYRLHGNQETLEAALAETHRALAVNFEGYTSEVRFTDRVLRFPNLFREGALFPEGKPGFPSPDTDLLYATLTGDPGSAGYLPLTAVRWLTPPRDLAALVTKATPSSFEAQLFHFGEAERAMAARFYLLQPGPYSLILTTDGKIAQEATLSVDDRKAEVAFTVPERRICTLSISAAE